MDIIFYFAFGLLNVCLLFVLSNAHKNLTGVYLFPEMCGSKFDVTMFYISYFIVGPLGTMVLFIIFLFLFVFWIKYYIKK